MLLDGYFNTPKMKGFHRLSATGRENGRLASGQQPVDGLDQRSPLMQQPLHGQERLVLELEAVQGESLASFCAGLQHFVDSSDDGFDKHGSSVSFHVKPKKTYSRTTIEQ